MKRYVLLLIGLLLMSCSDIVNVEDISEESVTILAPTNEAVLDNETVVFSWNALEDAETYLLQIAQPDFESANQVVLDSAVTSISFTQQLLPNSYQWRLRAQNSEYITVFETQSFIVNASEAIDITDEIVVLLAPAEDLSLALGDVAFSWDGVLGADSYELQIATPNFNTATDILVNTSITDNSISITDLPANSYEWRVKAVNTEFETAYTTQTFTIEE